MQTAATVADLKISDEILSKAKKFGACPEGIKAARGKTWSQLVRSRRYYAEWAATRMPLPEAIADYLDSQGCGRSYWKGDKLHRDDGPAAVWPDGVKQWRRNGALHREDGPAAVWPNGTQIWCCDDKLHRDDGPAAVWPDGTQHWYRDGKLHRDDGPAAVWPDGTELWYCDGHQIPTPE